MGILERIRSRIAGSGQDVTHEAEPVRLARARTDAEWIAPEGLDPHQRNLVTLMLRLREQTAQMTTGDALKRLGVPFNYELEALVPLPGPSRQGWSDRKMFESLSRDNDYVTMKGRADARVLDAIDAEMVRRLVAEPDSPSSLAERSYVLRADVTGRVADFMKSGRRLDERVAVESEMLERQSSSLIHDRFRDMPITSLRPMPDRGEARRAWIEDTLRAEHSAAHQGLLSPSAVVRAASQRRGPVQDGWEPAPVIADRSKEVQERVSAEAARIEKLSEASLRLRFRDVPGILEAPIPDVARGDDRRTWVETALLAQKVRETMQPVPGRSFNMAGKDHIALQAEVVQSVPAPSAGHRPAQEAARSFAVASMLGR